VILEGEVGDRYFLVDTGSLQISANGQPIGPIGPGGAFGEIALLRNVPRTATVIATERSELISIARESFLEAVTGHPQSSAVADGVVARYL
jgi:CRP-like cAMP-binding protein